LPRYKPFTNALDLDWPCYKPLTNVLDLDWPLIWWKQWKSDLRFSTWNINSLYRPWSLTTMGRQLARYQI
jgi:hypothetical protein